jgi:hypothetical protein
MAHALSGKPSDAIVIQIAAARRQGEVVDVLNAVKDA